MTVAMILRTVFEIALVGFTLWALFHEDRFAAFEERIVCLIRRKGLKAVNSSSPAVRRAVK